MTLRQIRKAAFAADAHQQAWSANRGIPPHKFRVGDLGYLPKGTDADGKDWENFVVLCNILEEGLAKLDISDATDGSKGSWLSGHHEQEKLTPYNLPDGLHGYVSQTHRGVIVLKRSRWAVVVPPEAEYHIEIVHMKEFSRVHDAWDYLLDVGKAMAETHDVKPEELILSQYSFCAADMRLELTLQYLCDFSTVTRVGTEQRFKVRDLRRVQYWPESLSHNGPGGFGIPHGGHMGFGGRSPHDPFGTKGGHGQRRLIAGQDLSFKVFYLLTSASKDHQPYFSQTPFPTPQPQEDKPPELDPNTFKCFAYLDM